MRLRIVAMTALLAAVTGLLIGCGGKNPSGSPDPSVPGGGAAPGASPADVTGTLYPPQPPKSYQTTYSRNPPIVIANALVQFEDRHIVCAEVDGTLELVAAYVKPEEMEKYKSRIVYHPRDLKKAYPMRRLSESDEVAEGQVIAFIDERQIDARIKGATQIKASAEIALKYATEGAGQAKQRVDQIKETVDRGGGAKSELIDAQLTLARFRENEANAEQTIAKTKAELEEATVQLAKHQVRSRVNGVIRSLERRPGHFVKAGEKIMEIESTDVVRIEGQLDVQYRSQIHRGMGVVVEPAVPSAPETSHKGHRQAVTGVAVAVTVIPDRNNPLTVPLVVSVGADGAALVWEPNVRKESRRPTVPHNLPHPVAVQSVAATPMAAKGGVFVITGGADGKVRIWDVTNPDKLPTAPKAEPEDAHGTAVQAIAVSPDGRHFATAAGRDVFVWELAGAKKLYALPAEHRDNVSSLAFTPQHTLVTASKDGTIKVWKLGSERAAVVRTIDHRAGAVEALGVSGDGARVLFDQDKGRIDLIDPATGQTVGQIENVSTAGSFSTLALFGPDETVEAKADGLPPYTIATAGDGDLKGTVQYWLAQRTGGRGAEVGRLVTPERAPVTAAAFSPARGENFFLAVGTSNGGVYVWKPPAMESRKPHVGQIVNIDPTDTRYVTVRVEISNKELKLIDRSSATIIITPKQ